MATRTKPTGITQTTTKGLQSYTTTVKGLQGHHRVMVVHMGELGDIANALSAAINFMGAFGEDESYRVRMLQRLYARVLDVQQPIGVGTTLERT